MHTGRFSASRNACALLCGVALTTLASTASAQIIDNFESYALGSLPSPTWLDVGAVLPSGRIPPFPSAYVISTLDAFGNPTKAVATVGDLATSKGIYAAVPVSTFYLLRADVRVDRYSDAPSNPAADWAMQLTFGQNGVDNWAYTPQLGIYASSLTRGWRLFSGTASSSVDIDLQVAANVGTWYTVQQSFDALLGVFHSQIWDAASGAVLLDTFNTLIDWNPADATFDAWAFMAGDLSPGTQIGNIGVVDNVNIVASTVPEPTSFALLAVSLLPAVMLARRRRR